MRTIASYAATALFAGLAACATDRSPQQADSAADTGAATPSASAPAPAPVDSVPDMKVEVDLAARQLYVMKGGQRVATHPVAVGSKEWPTQTGEWKIVQVVFNPEWIPPDESWAEERSPRKPGDPKNPLGVAQLIYDPPRTIHGTSDPSSIGKAVSHGSIRMRNETIVELAKQVLEAGGAAKDDAWIAAARENRTEKQIIDLPKPIPIRVF